MADPDADMQADVWARYLITNGMESPDSYERLVGYFRNRGLCDPDWIRRMRHSDGVSKTRVPDVVLRALAQRRQRDTEGQS